MLPLHLLRAALGNSLLIELRNGETFNGYLVSVDAWMNVHLKEAICTSRDGQRFWQLSEVFIRGSTIKYMQVSEEVLDKVKEDQAAHAAQAREGHDRPHYGEGRGGFRGGRGGARGGAGGRGGYHHHNNNNAGGEGRGGYRGGRGGFRGGRGGAAGAV